MRIIADSIFQPLKDFLFRTVCFRCGRALQFHEERICNECWKSLTPVKDDDYTYRVLCSRFAEEKYVDRLISLYYFEKGKLLQSLAHSLKYDDITTFGIQLGEKIAEKIQDFAVDCIVPVPLNKRKERERGYNQSDFIAQGIASLLKVPVHSRIVRRVKYTVTQTRLNAAERKENVAEAFTVVQKRLIQGKNILVVDDIITTGSTIQELAHVLKDSGAESIIAASAGLAKLGEDT